MTQHRKVCRLIRAFGISILLDFLEIKQKVAVARFKPNLLDSIKKFSRFRENNEKIC
jgi:hypothetical protein